MNKFGGFFARRAGLYDKPADPTPNATPPTDNPLELDEELFSALGAQLGGENKSLRNLLLDANAKIGELDGIKNAVGKLVDPVSKALRAFEAEKSEKISLQTVLNNTRTAYGKLRNEVAELEKKATFRKKNVRRFVRSLRRRRTCCAPSKRRKPRSRSILLQGARRSSISRHGLPRRPAKARRCAKKTAGSMSGFRPPTSA